MMERNKSNQSIKCLFTSNRSEKTKWREQLSELASSLEVTRKQHNELTTEKENISHINDELAGKVKFLKRENKKSLKMVCI
jgi:hypothetical protein